MTRPSRRGALLLEVAVAALLVGTLLVLSINAIGWTLRERRASDHRSMALQETGNILDEVTSLNWTEITQERLNEYKLPPEFLAAVPTAQLHLSLQQPQNDPTAKQITVAVEWPAADGVTETPARLTAWVYRVAEKQP